MSKNLFIFIIFISFCVVFTYGNDHQDYRKQFESFIKKYEKKYTTDSIEYEKRFQNFQENIKRANRKQKTDKFAKYGVNKFSDLSTEEFRTTRLSQKKYNPQALAASCLANGVEAPHLSLNIPSSFDWRTKNVVTPVKDQGQCGSCWAFSTTGVIESQWAIKGNNLTQYSEQMLVDCSVGCCEELNQTVCNQGCNGGWQWNAYEDIIGWGGLVLESDYPYTAQDGKCQRTKYKLHAPVKNYTCLSNPNGADEQQMASYLVSNGPLAVALNAEYVQDYTSGIISPWFSFECDPTMLDHAVLIVGYGIQPDVVDNIPFWIVKNSWGSDWGENGYFRIARGSGCCGINNAVSSVVLA